MWRAVDTVFVSGMAGALLLHVALGWSLDTVAGIAAWGVTMCGLRVWERRNSDRRALLDMAVVAVPALLFAAVAVSGTILVTPALLVAVAACVRLSVPYAASGMAAARRCMNGAA